MMLFLCASASRLQYLWQSFTRKQTIEIETLTKLNMLFQILHYYSPGFTNSNKSMSRLFAFFLQNRKVWNITQLMNSLRVIEDNSIQVQIQIVHVIYTVPSKCPAAVL